MDGRHLRGRIFPNLLFLYQKNVNISRNEGFGRREKNWGSNASGGQKGYKYNYKGAPKKVATLFSDYSHQNESICYNTFNKHIKNSKFFSWKSGDLHLKPRLSKKSYCKVNGWTNGQPYPIMVCQWNVWNSTYKHYILYVFVSTIVGQGILIEQQ